MYSGVPQTRNNTLLKSDVTRRNHVSVVMDPMNAGSRIVNFIGSISFATAQSSHNSEIYNIGAHAQWLRVNHEIMTTERVTFGL